MDKIKQLLKKPVNQHLVFWFLVYACYLTSNWTDFDHPAGVFSTYTIRILIQIGIAYACLLWVIPRYLRTKDWLYSIISLVIIVYTGHFLHTAGMVFFLEPNFPEAFVYCRIKYAEMSFAQRVFDLKYAFFISPANLFPPTFVLVAIQHYYKQQQLSELNEQKRAAELNALKHQINPHFLFNTLNNLYTLALKKSDQAPVAISKLSDILDYTLYRCNARYVALAPEVDLINSYLALEKLRYGKRVQIELETNIDHPRNIAPLLLLTFIENAFKHGVSQEIGQAKVGISLKTNTEGIAFHVQNTIPKGSPAITSNRTGIGLQNVRRQLNLLYPDRHQLKINQTTAHYSLSLQLQTL